MEVRTYDTLMKTRHPVWRNPWVERRIEIIKRFKAQCVNYFRGMPQTGFSLILSLTAIVFVLGCVAYVYFHAEDFYSVMEASKLQLGVAVVFILCSFMATCYQLDLFLRRFDLKIGKIELLAITHAMMLGNLVIPMRGGSGGLAIYLKKIHNLNFTAFAAIYGAGALLVALINSFLAFTALMSLWIFAGYFQLTLFVFVSSLLLVCLYFAVFVPSIPRSERYLMVRLREIADSWKAIILHRRLAACLTLSVTLMSFALIGSLYFIYRAINEPLTLEATVITSSVGSIVSLVPLTPGSIGVFDVAIIEIQRIFGLTTAQSIAAAIIFRTLTFLLSFLLGVPGMVYMYIKSYNCSERSTDNI